MMKHFRKAEERTAGAKAKGETLGKPASKARAEMTEVVLPQDSNPLGYILGGRVMHLVDIAAAIAAHRHSNSYVVTASVDYLDFRNPVRIGDLIILIAGEPCVQHLHGSRRESVFGKCPDGGAKAHHQRLCDVCGHR